ncbi:MAG: T9SS type A sorting domain-containing protein, partial [Sphingobacteriales bacterium]
LSVWTALVDTMQLATQTAVPSLDLQSGNSVRTYPNPFTNYSWLSFELDQPAPVTVRLYDAAGRLQATPFEKKRYGSGKHTVHIDASKLHLAAGEYLYEVIIGGKRYGKKVIRVE